MVEIPALEAKYGYTIEYDDGTEYVHLYFADIITLENPSFIRFDPLYEVSKELERDVSGVTVLLPYSRVIRIVKRKEPD
jgi:hypothetical protein